jgi:hypothetical protein
MIILFSVENGMPSKFSAPLFSSFFMITLSCSMWIIDEIDRNLISTFKCVVARGIQRIKVVPGEELFCQIC